MTDSFGARKPLKVGNTTYQIYRLDAVKGPVDSLPFSLKILLENLLRHEDGRTVTTDDVEALAHVGSEGRADREIAFPPARVLLQDFTGVPCVVDLAAMRDAIAKLGGDPTKINPLQPVDLVIDHSVQVDQFGTAGAFALNAQLEFERNRERYQFLRWGQNAFDNFRVVPPDTGIVHQVNLEYLARVVFDRRRDGGDRGVSGHARRHRLAHDDDQRPRRARLGRRRHRGRGRDARPADVDADPAGRRLQAHGQAARRRDGDRPRAHRHADAAQEGRRRQVRRVLRRRARGLPLADRATIANMAPEYGATMRLFPIDAETLRYLRFTGRPKEQIDARRGVREGAGPLPHATTRRAAARDTLELDLGDVEPSIAGPKRPQDRVPRARKRAQSRVDAKAIARTRSG